MKKSILNLGKALNKAKQKQINGGGRYIICSMEMGECPCNCFWDHSQCVMDKTVIAQPCH
ncbi:hypothetical protein CXF68_08185 [Tenacibaculum sp. Bg11-29]|uniref:hypothetical protein n=1 Tax=Tenacibaculum sp. Bg11-29 TaxID=2058306 RepID=UPI000C348641|nr:hypothetical protein [Tenacibaculum sp. Bg11-29]PKH50675.1 hypothetical protein CXF68_08185 [Tenacibaculum sp. Bg11-29]